MEPRPDIKQLLHDIWLRPRETTRAVVAIHPAFMQKELLLAFALISGITPLYQGIDMMSINLLLNFILIVFGIYGTAFLLWLTGKVIGGRAGFEQLSTALAWSLVPSIFGVAVACAFSLLGREVYRAAEFFSLFLLLWSLHIMVYAIAEVQEFSYWKSVLNNLLVLMLLLPPLVYLVTLLMNQFRTLMSV